MKPEMVERVAEQIAALMLGTKPASAIARYALALAEQAAMEGWAMRFRNEGAICDAVRRAVEGA